MKRIALIPSYQPDEKLGIVVNELLQNNFFVVVVNDGSQKEYEHYFEELPKSDSLVYLHYDLNHGKGHALKHGLNYIKDNNSGDYVVVTMDSDGQHKTNDAINICSLAEENKECLILGSRKLDKSCPNKSRFGNWFARSMFFLFTRTKIYDTQTGLRAFSNNLIEQIISSRGDRYEYEMNVLLDCSKNKTKIIEETIETIYLDNNSNTHYNPVKDSLKIFFELIKFSLSSIVGFLVDFTLYSLLIYLFTKDMPGRIEIANVLARVVSASVNFTINYKLVFKNKGNLGSSAVKYFSLAIVILACNTGLLRILVEEAHLYELLAKIIVEATLFIVSWLIQRLFVFDKKQR